MAVRWQAETAPDPRLLVLNEPLAAELGPRRRPGCAAPTGCGCWSATSVPDGATPVAQAYAGHQFGGFVPRLGDGRALLLGELVDADGPLRDLHLKGSGRTPFARGGDGLAAVGPMLREYVVSEAMHALGIPTTRSLAVVATGRPVHRETLLPGAVLARVASSHLRVGSFQYARATGDIDLLRRLADHAIARHHPAAAAAENPYLALFEAVVAAQASLVARWMLVGFVHGVMNTDNMTISGETIDYGPCAFMEAYDPATVYSSIDDGGRYAYGNQPAVAEWNLARLAEALLPLLARRPGAGASRSRVESLGGFRRAVRRRLVGRHAGQARPARRARRRRGRRWSTSCSRCCAQSHVDYTSFFRAPRPGRAAATPSRRAACSSTWPRSTPGWSAGARSARTPTRWTGSTRSTSRATTSSRRRSPPRPTATWSRSRGCLTAVTAPYDERPGLERYAEPAPEDFGAYRTFCGT